MKSSLSKKLVTLSASILMGVTPLANTTTAFASTSNVISTKTSTVTVSKKTYLLNQNGKELPVVLAQGEKVKVTAVLNLGKKTLYKIGNSSYWIDSSRTNGKVHYKNYGTNYTIQTSSGEINSKPQAQSTIIKLKKNAYLYNASGKKIGNFYIVKGTTLTNLGAKKINGKTYYNIGNDSYINSKNVAKSVQSVKSKNMNPINKNTTEKVGRASNWEADKNTLKLKKNAIPYNENGKKRTDLVYTYIKKNTVLNYYGTKIIHGKTYYNLGDGVYINGANVSLTSQN